MHVSAKQFQIDQMRKDKMIWALETIAVMILAIMVTVFLPSILFQFVYANQQLTAEPEVMKYIPTVSFAVAVVFFVYAGFMNMSRMMKIKTLEKELVMEMDSCDGDCCGGCNCGHDHMMEMDMPAKKVKSSRK